MNNLALHQLAIATWQTIYMIFVSGFLSIFFGLWCGIALYITSQKQILNNNFFNRTLGCIINTIRSIPFIILLISIIPLTRVIIGTSIGTNAAIIPLTIAAIPFFARLSESALKEVGVDLIETAIAMGASNWQIIYKVLIPEALPGLVRGATNTIIGLIGYSAMAGAVGGGGLGELAINYGYQRFNPIVMTETVIILIIIVQLTQSLGDYFANKRKLTFVLTICSVIFLGLIGSQFLNALNKPIHDELKVGVINGPSEEIMDTVKEIAQKKLGLNIKIVVFDDYVLPNTALENGSIDANVFQHIPYLEAQNKTRGYHLVSIAKTYVYPMAFYSKKITNVAQIKKGAIVAIPNDPSNEGRALLILEKNHYIKLRHGVGLLGTTHDIISNPYNLQFKTLGCAQLPRVFADADLVGLNNDYAKAAGLSPTNAIIKENADSPYANIVVVRANDAQKPIFKKLIDALHSPETEKITEKLFPNGSSIPAWKN